MTAATRTQRRSRRPLPRRLERRLPVHRPDPYRLGVSEARAGVPKTGSEDWVADGRGAAEWYAYSCGYDGETQR